MKTIPTDLAFPLVALGIAEEIGLSKREYFAGLAMQGILAAPECVLSEAKDIASIHGVDREVILAHLAALQADALIAELNKGDDDE